MGSGVISTFRAPNGTQILKLLTILDDWVRLGSVLPVCNHLSRLQACVILFCVLLPPVTVVVMKGQNHAEDYRFPSTSAIFELVNFSFLSKKEKLLPMIGIFCPPVLSPQVLHSSTL